MEHERHTHTNGNSHPLSTLARARASAESERMLIPFLAHSQGLSNQASQHFADSCPRSLPSPAVCPFGGACHACPVQTKLEVSQPGDRYEREADRVAEAALRTPAESARRPSRWWKESSTGSEESGLPPIKAKSASRIHGLGSSGRPLPESQRAFFESRLGYDFSQVRIHADSQAAVLARGIGARAFTFGHDIVFNAGEWKPKTADGRQLLAHELVHTVQQSSAAHATSAGAQHGEIAHQAPPNLLQRQSSDWLCRHCNDIYGPCVRQAEWDCMWGMFGRGLAGAAWGGFRGALLGGLLNPVLGGVGAVGGAFKGVSSGLESSQKCLEEAKVRCKHKADECWKHCDFPPL